MAPVTSSTTNHASSVNLASQSKSKGPTHSKGSFSLKAALKKPFQGWSKELLRARENDGDDYNFTEGVRRGYEPESQRKDT